MGVLRAVAVLSKDVGSRSYLSPHQRLVKRARYQGVLTVVFEATSNLHSLTGIGSFDVFLESRQVSKHICGLVTADYVVLI